MERVMILATPQEISEALVLFMEKYKPLKTTDNFDIQEKMDRRKAAIFIGVSYQTMCNWTKSGILKEHGQGRKKFYIRTELIEAINIQK